MSKTYGLPVKLKKSTDDELRADDIIVINPDPITTKDAVASIRKILMIKEFKVTLQVSIVLRMCF